MFRDIENDPYYQERREGTSQAMLLDQLDTEEDYLVERNYSEQQRFISIRPISCYYSQTEQYTAALHEPFVDYLALTYHDRFLSKHIDIPNTHNVADKRDVTKMEFLIKKGLEGRVTPRMTPFNPDIYNPFVSLLEMEEQQRSDLSTYVIQTLLNINEDSIFGPNKCPREERHKNVPKRNNLLEFIIQDHEDFIDVFKAERQTQVIDLRLAKIQL
ncbi:hypothetical protein L1887_25426 [Cichorium endivia]|nr:hypothetical protein L1887_25426 [Cichorium endivia]